MRVGKRRLGMEHRLLGVYEIYDLNGNRELYFRLLCTKKKLSMSILGRVEDR